MQPPHTLPKFIELDCSAFPDLAPGFAVWFALAGSSFTLSGLQRLPHKECDRILAIASIFERLNTRVQIYRSPNDLSLQWLAEPLSPPKQAIPTDNDHRMVFAASLLATRFSNVQIESPEAVVKSFPNWWQDLDLLV